MLSIGAKAIAGSGSKLFLILLRIIALIRVPVFVPVAYLVKVSEHDCWYKKFKYWNNDRYREANINFPKKRIKSTS